MGIFGDLPTLVAAVVAKEYETVGIALLEQHHARVGASSPIGGGQGHGVRLGQLRGDGFLHPALKLPDRIRVHIGLGQNIQGIVLTQFGKRLAHGGSSFPWRIGNQARLYPGLEPSPDNKITD